MATKKTRVTTRDVFDLVSNVDANLKDVDLRLEKVEDKISRFETFKKKAIGWILAAGMGAYGGENIKEAAEVIFRDEEDRQNVHKLKDSN